MRRGVIGLVLCLFSFATFAKVGIGIQSKNYLRGYYSEGGFDPDRLIIGGNLGMNFFKKGYTGYISPIVGYSFGRFQLGLSAGYNFYHEKLPYTNALTNLPEEYAFSSSNYSLSLFSRLALLGPLFIHVEPGYEFYKVLDDPNFTYEFSTGKAIEHARRVSIPIALVGGGFGFPIGDRVSFVIYGLYDLIQNPLSPYYGLPIIRGGFNVGSFGN